MKLKLCLLPVILGLCILPGLLLAAQSGTAGFGGMANAIMEPLTVVADFVQTASLALGIGFIFAGIVKYFDHRRSPLMVTMTTVVFLLIAGFVLVLLPFLPRLTGTGIPYFLLGNQT